MVQLLAVQQIHGSVALKHSNCTVNIRRLHDSLAAVLRVRAVRHSCALYGSVARKYGTVVRSAAVLL